jgi:RNA methyltransferase, TrmH family
MSTRIESLDNPRVKDAVRLRERRARRKTGRFLVEGRREVHLALEAGWALETLFVEEARARAAGGDGRDGRSAAEALLERAGAAGVRIVPVTPAVYAKLAIREEADGLLAVAPIPDVSPERLRLPAFPLVLAAVGIEKPGNVGALLRSADAFGADAFVVEGGTDLWNPNVVRASLGCLFTVPLAVAPPGGLRSWLESVALKVVAATPDGERLPREATLAQGVVLLVGSEERGLPADLLAVAHERVRIPMRGRADSLNVSVSAGILLYEADRQRAGRH